ncbi:uncharacterized protein MYCFIDRAFT_173339 [Pseudocercospora fijiensis CIRAD86]|uniref:Uncharacterized protein n=1 Tax=Pseudocercospora fijiensis (strain CIRAD86) TaxID=383855 RepID=M3B4M6_PSEFD|nr:uncharacterized protein MYCFIDRAFT_173339 [Pseudocercospora fijiensis CIRAD86]EME84328.1 hypothetical protein MYCFIDRAFT_173339 [Pseudocercospora fijiensis CIRAD86]
MNRFFLLDPVEVDSPSLLFPVRGHCSASELSHNTAWKCRHFRCGCNAADIFMIMKKKVDQIWTQGSRLGKRKAESGKRKAESGKRKAADPYHAQRSGLLT